MFIVLISFLFHFKAHGQKDVDMDSGPSFKDRVYTGGGLGFTSNSGVTIIGLYPLAGYMITRKLSVGLGITYQYYYDKFYDVDDHRYGGNIFIMQMLVYRLFLMSQYSIINLNPRPQDENYPRESYTRVLIGGGLSQPLGKATLNFTLLYDVTAGNNSPYASPWVIGAFISI